MLAGPGPGARGGEESRMGDHFLALLVADLVGAVTLWKATRAGARYPLGLVARRLGRDGSLLHRAHPRPDDDPDRRRDHDRRGRPDHAAGRRDRRAGAPRHAGHRRPAAVRALAAGHRRPRLAGMTPPRSLADPFVYACVTDGRASFPRCCWAEPASARCSTGCWRTSAAARARSWSYAARRASARRRSCTTAPGRRPASASRRSPASSPRWSCPSRGLHQLCAPMLDRLDALPEPQRDALCVALGLAGRCAARPLPRRAWPRSACCPRSPTERPLLCVVDDAQWLDAASAPGPRVRRAPAAGGVGGDRVRRARPGDERELDGPARADARQGSTTHDARALLATVDPGPARRARPRPDHRRDARQPARAAGAAARA